MSAQGTSAGEMRGKKVGEENNKKPHPLVII